MGGRSFWPPLPWRRLCRQRCRFYSSPKAWAWAYIHTRSYNAARTASWDTLRRDDAVSMAAGVDFPSGGAALAWPRGGCGSDILDSQ